MDEVIGRDAHEILVERSVVDRAKAKAVADNGLAMLLEVSHNVRRIEGAELFQPADRALAAIRGHHSAAEASLMEPDAHLSNRITALQRIFDRRGRGLVDRSAQRAGSDKHHPPRRIVLAYVAWEDRLVPTRSRSDEVDVGNL